TELPEGDGRSDAACSSQAPACIMAHLHSKSIESPASPEAKLQITSIEWRGIRVPFKSPDAVRNGVPMSRHTLVVWVGTDYGLVGVGEAAPPGTGHPDDVVHLARLFHELAPSALGMDPGLALDILSAIAPRTSLGDVFRFGLETA